MQEKPLDSKNIRRYLPLFTASLQSDFARRCASVESQNQLARRFGVCRGTILDVLRGHTWKEFPSPTREGALA